MAVDGRTARDRQLEHFTFEGTSVVRRVRTQHGSHWESSVPRPPDAPRGTSAADAFDASWLQSRTRPKAIAGRRSVRVADLFSGCGGMSLGAWEACRAVGARPVFAFAADLYRPALDVYRTNFEPLHFTGEPIERSVDGEPGDPATAAEKALRRRLGAVDVVLSGPPCQGHSDLNNRTRRRDPKNQLILRVVRFAELLKPSIVVIENVQGIRHDQLGALQDARALLHGLGYQTTEAVLHADDFGVAQQRRRFFLVARRSAPRDLTRIAAEFTVSPRNVRWAIGDLASTRSTDVFDSASTPQPTNRARIDYLFDNALYELPNDQRPACHADGEHSYNAVYGRLRWTSVAPTITTGFGCMGQGRYVHPQQRRTLTPHEAARIQFFPDFFQFGKRKRGEYQQLIGNAVPSKLSYSVLLGELILGI